jgi:hypothetical protein
MESIPKRLMSGGSYFFVCSHFISFGIVMWEIFNLGKVIPYKEHTIQEVILGVPKGLREDPPSKCPQNVGQLMQMCWARDPRDRPSFSQIVSFLASAENEEGTVMSNEISESIELMEDQIWFKPMLKFFRNQKIPKAPLLHHIEMESLSPENEDEEESYIKTPTELSVTAQNENQSSTGNLNPEFFY